MVIRAPLRRRHWSRGFEHRQECVGIWGKSTGGRGDTKCRRVRGVLLGVSEGQERGSRVGPREGQTCGEYSRTTESFWRLLSGDLTCSK